MRKGTSLWLQQEMQKVRIIDTNIAAHLSAPATGGSRFLEVLDEDCFSIDFDGSNSILGNGDSDSEYAFTGKHHDYCGKFNKSWDF